MQIFIKTSSDNKQPIEIAAGQDGENGGELTKISDVKSLVAASLQIPVEQQRLIFCGRVLKDADTLKDLKIVDGSTIHLVKSQLKPQNASPTAIPAAAAATSNASSVNADASSQGASAPASAIPSAAFGNSPFAAGNPFGAAMPQMPFGNGEMDAQLMSLMNNPEIIQRTTRLMAEHPELLNMASNVRCKPSFSSCTFGGFTHAAFY